MDNQEFFDLYMADTLENLNIISQNILHLEKDPTSSEYIQEMFRAAHSIKGSAGQMQFHDIANVTHKLEDLFGALRDETILATPEIIDLVLKTLDCLELLHEQLEDESIEVDISVIDDIVKLLSTNNNEEELNIKNEALETKEIELIKTALAGSRLNNPDVLFKVLDDSTIEIVKSIDGSEYKAYYIHAMVDDDCDYKGVRMYMLLEVLANEGEVIATFPSAEEIDSDKLNTRNLDIILITDKDKDSLYTATHGVLEMELVECCVIPSSLISSSEESISDDAYIDNNEDITKPKDLEACDEIENDSFEKDIESSNIKDISLEDTNNNISNNITSNNEEDVKTITIKNKPKVTQKTKSTKDTNLYVRVHTKTLDTLLNEQGELLLEYNRLCSVLDKARKKDISMSEMIDVLDDIGTNINKINTTQQAIIMSTRMFPLEQLFSMFPRMIRDLSSNLGKDISLVIEGQDTKLDRTILERVSDPLKHIIRNAVDHGVESPEERIKKGKEEQGTITLSAKQESDSVVITVQDDGKGIDPEVLKRKAIEKGIYTESQAEKLTDEEILNIIFAPGFSTASEVTEVSGRGVGMDIVRSSLSEIGGIILIDSVLGKGTTFTVKIPLTLAISKALLVTVETEKYVILLNYIQEVTEANREESIKRIQHKDHIVIRDKIYPLVYLRDVYGYKEEKKEEECIILISNNGRQIGLVADGFLGQQDIVVKGLNKYFNGQVKYEAGITKLGDGSIPIIVDVPAIMDDF